MNPSSLWRKIGPFLYRVLFNPYGIVLLVFCVVMLFFGEQSMVKRVERKKQIAALQEKKRKAEQEVEFERRQLRMLEDSSEVERIAREQYYMHAPDEDVYLIEP